MVDKDKQGRVMTDLDGFLVVCPDCEANKITHKTMVYVDWDKQLYSITCETCGRSVYFDYYGNIIPRTIAKDLFAVKKEERILN